MAHENYQRRLGPQGRIIIPAQLRRLLNLDTGVNLVARVESGRLVLEKREDLIARLKGRFAVIPKDESLADELIADRRTKARRESE